MRLRPSGPHKSLLCHNNPFYFVKFITKEPPCKAERFKVRFSSQILLKQAVVMRVLVGFVIGNLCILADGGI